MKKFILKNAMALVALAIAAGSYTLMSFGKGDIQSEYFYEYTSSSTDEIEIKNIENYERKTLNPCNGQDNVCGALLPTDTGENNQPDLDEFDEIAEELWNSQDEGESTHLQVVMKN